MSKRSIDVLPLVADLNGAAVLAESRADAVVADTAFKMTDVAAATSETGAPKRLKSTCQSTPFVAAAEVGQPIVSEHASVAEHLAQVKPAATAIAWFGPTLTAAVVDIVNAAVGLAVAAAVDPAINATVDPAVEATVDAAMHRFEASLDAAMGRLEATIAPAVAAAVGTTMGTLEARIDNQEIKRHNHAVRRCVRLPLLPLKKQVDGNGMGLPGHAILAAALPDEAPFAIGVPIPFPLFPVDMLQLRSLSHHELSELSAIINNDFGIVPEDNLVDRVWKFERFVS